MTGHQTKLTRETATDFFAILYRGAHRLPSKVRDDGGGCFSVQHYQSLSTFDYDELTRLVLLAHERHVRAWVQGSSPRHIRICIQARLPYDGEISTGHPTIEQAAEKFRTADDQPWWSWYSSKKNP